MVKSIRIMTAAIGIPDKKFLQSEQACFEKLGKSVVAGKNLKKGTQITKEDLKIKVNLFMCQVGHAGHAGQVGQAGQADQADCTGSGGLCTSGGGLGVRRLNGTGG